MHRKRSRLGLQYVLLVAGIATGVLSYCTVLATVSTVSFDVLYDEYEIPMFPLILYCLTFQTALEAVLAVRWLRTKFPAPATAGVRSAG